ncbi:hypothetical protein QFZ77_004656 [Paenibacillus sp. V4I3]|nr:hypothetical protein [Paenibacillus sp. V4I3]
MNSHLSPENRMTSIKKEALPRSILLNYRFPLNNLLAKYIQVKLL